MRLQTDSGVYELTAIGYLREALSIAATVAEIEWLLTPDGPIIAMLDNWDHVELARIVHPGRIVGIIRGVDGSRPLALAKGCYVFVAQPQ